MIGTTVNIVIATICILLTVKSLGLDYLYLLLLSPFLSAVLRRNPFNTPTFITLLLLLSTNYLPTQSYLGFLNVLYNFRSDLAVYLRYIFTYSGGETLPIVVTLYSVSQVVWVAEKKRKTLKERGVDFNVFVPISIALIVGLASYTLYRFLYLNVVFDRLTLGLIGVFLVILTLILLRR